MSGSEPLIRKNSLLFAELCSALLERGNAVRFRVQGESMRPNLLDGDLVTVAPVAPGELRPGDVALIQNADGLLIHRVVESEPVSGRIVTSSDTGLEPDPSPSCALGRAVARSRAGNSVSLTLPGTALWHAFRTRMHCLARAAALRSRRLRSFLLPVLLLLLGVVFQATPAAAQALSITDTASATTVTPTANITYKQVLSNTSGI